MAGKIIAWSIGAILTLLYASTVVAAVGNLVGLPSMAEVMGLGITGVGWFWLWFGAVMPVVIFGIAIALGRGKGAAARLLVLAAGLCVVAAVQLEVALMVPRPSFFA